MSFIISDLVYISKNIYVFNQVKSRHIGLLNISATSLYTRGFCYLVNIITFIINKANVYIKKKS